MSEVKTKETLPFWLAVGIVSAASLPLVLYLGDYKIPVWAAFTTWATYFLFGAKPGVILSLILPCFAWGSLCSTLAIFTWMIGVNYNIVPDLAPYIGFLVFLCLVIYGMRWWKGFTTGTIAVFMGVSQTIAIFATNFYPAGPNILVNPWICFGWAVMTAVIGGIFGWVNVILTFPRKV